MSPIPASPSRQRANLQAGFFAPVGVGSLDDLEWAASRDERSVHLAVLDLLWIEPASQDAVMAMCLTGQKLANAKGVIQVKTPECKRRNQRWRVLGAILAPAVVVAVGPANALGGFLIFACLVILVYTWLTWAPKIQNVTVSSDLIEKGILMREVIAAGDEPLAECWTRLRDTWAPVDALHSDLPSAAWSRAVRSAYAAQVELAMLASATRTNLPEAREHRERFQMALEQFESLATEVISHARIERARNAATQAERERERARTELARLRWDLGVPEVSHGRDQESRFVQPSLAESQASESESAQEPELDNGWWSTYPTSKEAD